MEALTQSSSVSKFLAIRNGDLSYSSPAIAIAPVFRFPVSDNKINADFSLRSTKSLIAMASVANVDSLPQSAYQANTVQVKFQLQRECAFGEHFFLIGDDPMIGLWDPASAIPLNWSDEHLWMVELDFPVGKSIRFKFILKGPTEQVLWQPGPDRMFETWETKNTIVISEDWENPETQNITEVPSKDPIADQIFAEEISNAIGNNGLAAGEETVVNGAGSILTKTGIAATEKKLGSVEDENMVGYVQEPVLVPGLTTSVTIRSEEILSTKAESNSELRVPSVIDEDEDEDPGMSKPDEEEEHEKKEAEGSQNQEGATITVIDNVCGQEQDSSELKENDEINTEHELAEGQVAVQDALQNDFQWGRKTLSKFFNNAGTFFR